ncbi:MAG: MFS transporter [Nocardioidaceae bacterium]|nr:MFS transporter [Nocardioidaceae bacterium]MCL2614967.1 MFS transporter [Nocardioidaceae bacterium]
MTSDVAAPPALWRHRDFRRLWIGETVSQLGSEVTGIALPLVAVLALHASTFQVGLLTAFDSLGFLVVGLPAGAWVDRMRLRWVLIVNDLVRAAALASIPIASWLGALGIAQLYLVGLVVGVSTVFFDVAYQSYLPELIDRGALVRGNAGLQASESVSRVAGPGLGGLLIQALTAPYAVVVDAASFLWSAIWVGTIATRPPKPTRKPDRHLGREIREGLSFVIHNRMLRAIAMCTGSSNFFSSMAIAVFYVLLARQLHVPAGIIGLITATSAIGGVVGSLLASRVAARLGQGPTIWLSMAIAAPLAFVVPFVHRDWSLVLLALTQLVWWGTVVVYNIAQVSFRQGLCPPDLLGRMNATMRFLVWGTIPLGALAGGTLGEAVGVRPTLLVAAVGGAFAWLPPFLSPQRWTRELPRYDDAPARRLGDTP